MTDPRSPEFGYLYYPSQGEFGLGYPRLDVFLSERPTEKHFDPESVSCQAALGAGEVRLLVVEHPWTLDHHYRVMAGSLILRDRNNKTHLAYCYGAELTIHPAENQTLCSFTSQAPILAREIFGTAPDLLSIESELLLAERRAAWADNPAGFEARLAALEPQRLFRALVIALRERYRRLPVSENPEMRHLQHLINQEFEALQRQGQALQGLALEEIL